MAGFQELPTVDDDVAADKYGGAIPGQSLTDEPGSRTWENPPEITDPDEAVSYVITRFEQNEETQSAYSKLMLAGMPIESIVNTISFGGFFDGKWGVDVAEIIKPPLMAFFVAFADEYGIPYRVFNNPNELKNDGIPDAEVLNLMADRNPKAFNELQEGVAMNAQTIDERNQGFLGAPPPMDAAMEDAPPLDMQVLEQEGE